MKRKDKIAVSVIAVFAVGVLVYLVAPGVLGSKHQTTNDAFVAADFTLVAPRVAGFIKEVLVEDNQRVKAGQLLALIDDRDFRAAAQAADADTLVAQAQLKNASATLERQSSVIAQAQATMEFFMSGSIAKVLTLLTVISILMVRPQGLFTIRVRR